MGKIQNYARCHLGLDDCSGFIQFDGAALPLQYKVQQILRQLVHAAPLTVSRAELIDQNWSGNYLTGDKGLRQAIWAIRAALDDKPGAPRFIRTIPRSGYRWIGPKLPSPGWDVRIPRLRDGISALIFTGLLAISFTAGVNPGNQQAAGQAEQSWPAKVSKAVIRNNMVVVDFESGCRGFIRSEESLLAGEPVVSTDGLQVVFPIIRNQHCQLVLFEPGREKTIRYSACPVLPDMDAFTVQPSEKTI